MWWRYKWANNNKCVYGNCSLFLWINTYVSEISAGFCTRMFYVVTYNERRECKKKNEFQKKKSTEKRTDNVQCNCIRFSWIRTYVFRIILPRSIFV